MTNGDKVRSMTDEEIAMFISDVIDCCQIEWQRCEKCPLNGAGKFCSDDEFAEYFGKEVSEDAEKD